MVSTTVRIETWTKAVARRTRPTPSMFGNTDDLKLYGDSSSDAVTSRSKRGCVDPRVNCIDCTMPLL